MAPEVVQTSAMDCGPATLTCLLQGLGLPASYGRLREACQTSVDGTSIDTMELTAQQLGARAEQVMIPVDHVLLPEAAALPAIAVVKQSGGAPHFVVLWRRWGPRVQVMDPATGRRWLQVADLQSQLFRHEHRVPAADWRAWAGTEDFLRPLRARMAALHVPAAQAQALLTRAVADEGWFSLGALDACTRFTQALVDGNGIRRGAEAASLLQASTDATRRSSDDIFSTVPQHYWSTTPDADSVNLGALHLRLSGAVLVRATGTAAASADLGEVPTEVVAARAEKPAQPLRQAFKLLRSEGLLAPLALAGAMAVAAGALVIEALLFRGIFDVAWQLGGPGQRVAGLGALVLFAVLLMALEVPIMAESLRLGRHLETRLRMALLAKLPRLSDRYFASRAVGDMAERSHALQHTRQIPSLALNLVQGGAELLLTLVGIAWLAPASLPWALAVAVVALGLPLLLQPVLAERELRVRQHATALHGLLLDTLLAAVPVRTHQAATTVRRQHENLLVHWLRASRAEAQLGLGADALQGLLCMGFTAWMLLRHFTVAGAVTGGDLLLVYWALKLPSMASGLGSALRGLPAQRNVLLRLLEPLRAPDEARAGKHPAPAAADAPPTAKAVSLTLENASVLAGGHTVLEGLSLHIPAGQHVAIVGASGAGKSSLVGLLLGWHTLSEGRLLVNQQQLRSTMRASLRNATAWVDPGVQLWNRPLLDNLVYASDDDGLGRLAPVIEATGLREVMRTLPQGLRTPLGEGGARLSGGQAQRVRLARAFLQQNVRLAVLDEPFRGLDRGQRAALLEQARRWWKPCTLLCVTHDVGETQQFDRVLVLDGGRIVEDGTPAELLARGGAYSALLQAEDQVRRQMWAGAEWRHLRMDAGQLSGPLSHGAVSPLNRTAANAPFAPLVKNRGAVPLPPPAPWSRA